MKLIVDNSNVAELPVGNLMDVADMAHRFGDGVEKGDFGDLHRAIVVAQGEDGSLTILGWGENTTSHELMGLLDHAKLQVFADLLADD